MIEVEQKFLLTEDQKQKLAKDAKFLHQQKWRDIYYDDAHFSLGLKDWWLRCRDGKWVMKVPVAGDESGRNAAEIKTSLATQYEEINEEDQLRIVLQLENNTGNFAEDLQKAGYHNVAQFETTRQKYQMGDFVIDMDLTNFGYEIGEIELMVSDKSQTAEAQEKIARLANKYGLVLAPVRGKVIEFIKKNNPSHYAVLKSGNLSRYI